MKGLWYECRFVIASVLLEWAVAVTPGKDKLKLASVLLPYWSTQFLRRRIQGNYGRCE